MRPVTLHIPSPPQDTVPPPELANAALSFKDPSFQQVGLTSTVEGQWAALVIVPPDTEVPIARIETFFAPYPVIYEAGSVEPLIPYQSSSH
jgi:hypothetical protein